MTYSYRCFGPCLGLKSLTDEEESVIVRLTVLPASCGDVVGSAICSQTESVVAHGSESESDCSDADRLEPKRLGRGEEVVSIAYVVETESRDEVDEHQSHDPSVPHEKICPCHGLHGLHGLYALPAGGILQSHPLVLVAVCGLLRKLAWPTHSIKIRVYLSNYVKLQNLPHFASFLPFLLPAIASGRLAGCLVH